MAIDVQGLFEAIAKIKKISTGDFLNTPTLKYSRKVLLDVQTYPPPRNHRRTNELGRKWYAHPGKAEIEFENTKPYAAWVQKRDEYPRQVWWHAETGWKTLEDAIDDNWNYFVDEVLKEIRSL